MLSPSHVHFLLVVSLFCSSVNSECYGANTSTFVGCSGYEKAGYKCFGEMCAIDHCVGDCNSCAVHYPMAILDSDAGLCCDSVKSGNCVGSKDGLSPYKNEDYGFPDHIGALIVEGAMEYPNGPSIWSPSNPSGAYGWSWIAPGATSDNDCPSIPSDKKFDSKLIKPFNMKQRDPEYPAVCGLGCDFHLVSSSGHDPCTVGNRPDIPIEMRCFSGGSSWMGTGICGFACQLRSITNFTQFCEAPDPTKCLVYCDPRGPSPSTSFTLDRFQQGSIVQFPSSDENDVLYQ